MQRAVLAVDGQEAAAAARGPARPSAPPPSPASPCWRGRRPCPPPARGRWAPGRPRPPPPPPPSWRLGVGGHRHRALRPDADPRGRRGRRGGRAVARPPRWPPRHDARPVAAPPARPGVSTLAPGGERPRPRSGRGRRPRRAGRCVPTEPVEPRMERPFDCQRSLKRERPRSGAVSPQRRGSNSTGRARRTASCRAGRASPRGRERARPESFTPAQRLSRLSTRSPAIPRADDDDAEADRVPAAGRSGRPSARTTSAPSDRRRRARRRAPSTVLPGEIAGRELVPAQGACRRRRPTVSAAMTMARSRSRRHGAARLGGSTPQRGDGPAERRPGRRPRAGWRRRR